MKKKLLTFVLAAAMVLSMPTALFAAEAQSEKTADTPTVSEGNEIAPRSTTSATVGASRKSSTSGSVSANASFNTKASKATCTITLQVKSNGSWKTATDLPVYSYIKTEYNTYSIIASRTFTLKSGKVYRAKVVISDTNSNGTYSTTRYTGSF
ncbi:hypothetical protein H8692_04295 [Mogibacterium sp. NSJ-24]|uniref:Uncharacterized protein n=1 Tax=Lentihominibacter hominis TaxID=2763645 RepID=A0A926EA16_9FIRM|nr:hypothetical protein [Lentihominibacter hominis]MBC8567987.1 hypothetical protein [Lentihominibacter hominis]